MRHSCCLLHVGLSNTVNAMKKKKTSSFLDSLRYRFPPIPFYRSDLEEIVRIAETRELQVRISDDKYEYESLDDLKENRGNRIKKLTLTLTPQNSTYTSITIEIDNDGVLLRSSKDDKLVSVWHEIKDAIEKQAPWYARFMKPLSWSYGALIFIWLSPKKEQIREGFEWVVIIWISVASFMILLSFLSVLYLNRSRGIYLQREHEVQGFWDRYGEKLVFLVLGTIIGVIGKVVSDKLSGQ